MSNMESKQRKDNIAIRVALRGVLIALAMIFSYVEALIPISIGIPGIKLGVANLVVVIALFMLSKRDALLISFIRILLMGLLFGNGASLIYSMTGGMLSLLVMILAKKYSGFSIAGISILGGVFHNVGQIAAATIILSNLHIVSYLPVLLVAGVITGMLIGLLADQIMKRIKNIRR